MKRLFILLSLAAVMLTAAGCGPREITSTPAPTIEAVDTTPDAPQADYLSGTKIAGYRGQGNTAVEDALAAHKQLNAVTQRLLAATEANRELDAKHRAALSQIGGMTEELAAVRKQLADAEKMIALQQQDLKEWKADVLGHRAEIQKALLAILNSQQKLLQQYGVDIDAGSAKSGQTTAMRTDGGGN